MNACARNRSAPRGRPIGAPSWSRGIDHNRCDRVALFVVPVAAKIAKLAAFEPMRRCAAKAVRALLESETMGRRSPSFGARFLARALKIIKSLRSPVIGQDQFAGRLVAARPVGKFAVPVVLFPWGAHAIILHGARGAGEAVHLDSFVKVGEFHHGLFLHSGAIGARWMA